jgi:hypothetical protein
MADTLPTLANLIKVNDANALDLGLSDLLQNANLLRNLYAMPASNGTQHKYVKRTTAPSAGKRAANDGLDRTFGADTTVTIDLGFYDADHIVDVAIAKGYKKGDKAYIAREIPSQIQSLMWKAEQDVIADFAAAIPLTTNAMFVNGGASTGSVNSSVYAIRSNGEKEIAIVIGNEGEVTVGDTSVSLTQGANSKTLSVYVTPVNGYLKVQLGSVYSLARLGNLDASSNKLTDAKIANLINLAPADRPFTHLVMNRRSLAQLQAARTATNATGAPAPFPTEAFGIPIIVTDAIVSTETIVAAS